MTDHNAIACEICSLARWGLTVREISERLTMDRRRIYGHLKARGVELNAPDKAVRKNAFFAHRASGLTIRVSAEKAGITLSYAMSLGAPPQYDDDGSPRLANGFPNEDAYVAALIKAGGFARLSEKPTRTGPVVCLPLIQFERAA
jgi:hypothetical protein